MNSATERGARSPSKETKRKANALETCDKDDSAAHFHSEKRNFVIDQPGKRSRNTLKTTDIALILNKIKPVPLMNYMLEMI